MFQVRQLYLSKSDIDSGNLLLAEQLKLGGSVLSTNRNNNSTSSDIMSNTNKNGNTVGSNYVFKNTNSVGVDTIFRNNNSASSIHISDTNSEIVNPESIRFTSKSNNLISLDNAISALRGCNSIGHDNAITSKNGNYVGPDNNGNSVIHGTYIHAAVPDDDSPCMAAVEDEYTLTASVADSSLLRMSSHCTDSGNDAGNDRTSTFVAVRHGAASALGSDTSDLRCSECGDCESFCREAREERQKNGVFEPCDANINARERTAIVGRSGDMCARDEVRSDEKAELENSGWGNFSEQTEGKVTEWRNPLDGSGRQTPDCWVDGESMGVGWGENDVTVDVVEVNSPKSCDGEEGSRSFDRQTSESGVDIGSSDGSTVSQLSEGVSSSPGGCSFSPDITCLHKAEVTRPGSPPSIGSMPVDLLPPCSDVDVFRTRNSLNGISTSTGAFVSGSDTNPLPESSLECRHTSPENSLFCGKHVEPVSSHLNDVSVFVGDLCLPTDPQQSRLICETKNGT